MTLGCFSFTAATRVRLPYGTPNFLKYLDDSNGSVRPETSGHSGVTSTFRIASSLRSAPANQHQHLSRARRNPDTRGALSQCRRSKLPRGPDPRGRSDTKVKEDPSRDGRECFGTR